MVTETGQERNKFDAVYFIFKWFNHWQAKTLTLRIKQDFIFRPKFNIPFLGVLYIAFFRKAFNLRDTVIYPCCYWFGWIEACLLLLLLCPSNRHVKFIKSITLINISQSMHKFFLKLKLLKTVSLNYSHILFVFKYTKRY